MGTFITDKLHHLNNDIVQLFHLDAQPTRGNHHHTNSPYDSPTTSRAKPTIVISSDTTKNHEDTILEQSNLEFLSSFRASIEALDLHSGVVPSMEKVVVEIEKVESLLESVSANRQSVEASKLEHLFMAKCTVAVYLHLLDIILNATLPLASEIEYWQSLLDSRSWRLMYILQTSPYRLYSMTRSVVISTRQHLESLIGASTQELDRKVNTLQLLQFFPTFLKRHLIEQPVSFPVAIRYEIIHHRKQLQRIREYQAECLGLLAEQGLDLNSEYIEDSISSMSSSSSLTAPNIEDYTRKVDQFVQEQVSKTVCLMERVLTKASKDTHHVTNPQQQKIPSRNASRSLTMLGNLHDVSNLEIDQVLDHLKLLIQVDIPRYLSQTEIQAKKFHRPSWLTRVWIPVLIGYFGLKFGIQYVSDHRADLDEMLEEGWDTVRKFVTDWVWEPSVRIMEIIRHTDDQGSLQMLGNESLKSDIASLERMVLDFGKEHYHLASDELANLSKAVHNGDISMVMRAYEQELKKPLKGAVIGHLIQTLLIQVQKTKVDVEVAMAALDKLLKANELNFAFLAVGPSLLVLWATTSQAKSIWQRAAGRNLGLVSIQMRNSLRQVERLLNLASKEGDGPAHYSKEISSASLTPRAEVARSDSQDSDEYEDLSDPTSLRPEEPLSNSLLRASERVTRLRAKEGKVPYRTQGLILCEVHLLRSFAARLTRSEGLRDKVMEDLREIEESSLTVHQRLRTAKRMYRTYGFLGLHQH
ncbi:Nuclear control of ATPase protein 2 [Mortierella sp. AM989]|nr:Nuclear control of ATPase protein 2 [Mortierella sp. AM989]